MTAPILFKEDLGQRRYDLDWVRIGAFLGHRRNIPRVYSSSDGYRRGGACAQAVAFVPAH